LPRRELTAVHRAGGRSAPVRRRPTYDVMFLFIKNVPTFSKMFLHVQKMLINI
jgi:hypothetical protein